jgi:hypothetical protein
MQSEERPTINWSYKMLQEFKVEQAAAKKAGLLVFTYHDHEWDVDYAKYLIEYLERVFRDAVPLLRIGLN